MSVKRIALVAAVMLLALLGWRVYQKLARAGGPGAGRARPAGTVAVALAPVRRQEIRDVRRFTGTLAPQSQFLVAPKVAGRLDQLLVNIGHEVRQGDLIAVLDGEEYRQQVEQARAELEVARANTHDTQSTLEIAARDLERVRELRKERVASVSEMDKVEALHKAAQAKHAVALSQIKQREAALKAAEIRLAYTQIRAAWEDGDGTRVIGERYVDEGAMLRANDPIVSILDVATLLAVVFVIERDYPAIAIGQPAAVTTDAFPGEVFPGRVARKAPLLRESSRQARVEIEISNPDRRLAPGMFVRVELQFDRRAEAVVVPAAALARRNGQTGVFLADEETLRARFVPVTVGIVNGEMVEIRDPPLAGRVVTLGQHLLEDGAAIRIPEVEAPAAEAGAKRPGVAPAGRKGRG